MRRFLPQPGCVGTPAASCDRRAAARRARSRRPGLSRCAGRRASSPASPCRRSRAACGSGPARMTSRRALSAPEIVFSSATSPVASMTGTRPRWMMSDLERRPALEAERAQRLLGGAEEQRAVDLVEQRALGRRSSSRPPAMRPACRRDSVSSAIRRMNRSAASTKPTDTATTMSTSTVSRKQVEQHEHVALGRDAHDADEVVHLGHVPGDEQQQRGERRHRQVGDQRRERQHRHQHEQRVHDRRERRARAGADVGGGARERAGRGDAAEERRDDVADAERDQLGVRDRAACRSCRRR